MDSSLEYQIETLAIHAGSPSDPLTGAVNVPVYLTSTYAQKAPGEHLGYEYSRTKNPTRSAFEAHIAALEGAKFGVAMASGCAATDAVLHCLSAGDRVVAGDDLYGGTYRLFEKVHRRHGLTFDYVPTADVSAFAEAVTEETKLVWIESPSNPLLSIADIEAICAIATQKGVPVVVDNTFATPYLQQPLALGASLVVHSTTKYLGGHADVVGGAIVTNDSEWADRLYFVQNSAGAIMAPFDAFLTLRGCKTLHVRMDRHVQNAGMIADYLQTQKVSPKLFIQAYLITQSMS